MVSCDVSVTEDEEVELPSSVLTTYTGALTYTGSDGTIISENDGTAVISESGSTYTIEFNYNVPTLSGLRFEDNNGSYATIGTNNSSSGIAINGDEIDIAVTKSGDNWAFAGTK